MTYNEKLRKLRMVKGLTRSDVERKAGISYSCIKELERGESNPTIFTLETLCDFYRINVWDLLNPEWKPEEITTYNNEITELRQWADNFLTK